MDWREDGSQNRYNCKHLHTDQTERCVYVKYLEGELYIRRIVLDQEETSVFLFSRISKQSWRLPRFLFIRNIKKKNYPKILSIIFSTIDSDPNIV